mmetsp:Transcript_9986/g.32726  ORF Transcript_9986/g.32726 Transcript_9986/m.32726 type:complete len:319 (+) Transcript_9986:528-1484(+)
MCGGGGGGRFEIFPASGGVASASAAAAAAVAASAASTAASAAAIFFASFEASALLALESASTPRLTRTTPPSASASGGSEARSEAFVAEASDVADAEEAEAVVVVTAVAAVAVAAAAAAAVEDEKPLSALEVAQAAAAAANAEAQTAKERLESLQAAANAAKEASGLREKFVEMQRTELERLTFGKSAIHGWGLFARIDMPAGIMVIEFKGERVRNFIAELREQRYERERKDCYLLRVSDEWVIDSTLAGNHARFTNHSCNPNMYAKIFNLDGSDHIVFFTRKAVTAGTELTYDYRFEVESGSVPCYCAAPNCRGVLC